MSSPKHNLTVDKSLPQDRKEEIIEFIRPKLGELFDPETLVQPQDIKIS